MTDIVERLRKPFSMLVAQEAADEIDRLRTEVKVLRTTLERWDEKEYKDARYDQARNDALEEAAVLADAETLTEVPATEWDNPATAIMDGSVRATAKSIARAIRALKSPVEENSP